MKISQKTIVVVLLLLSIGLGIALAIQINTKSELASQLSWTTNELNQRVEELKTAKEKYQDARGKLYQTAAVCDIYDSFFVNFPKSGIELPLYEYDPKDQEIVNKAEAYIQSQINPEQELIFKIGPVTQKEDGEYIVKFITYKKLGLNLDSTKGSANLDENLVKLTGGVPPTTLKGYSLKYSNGHFEYWG
ncbi:hypothetical protein [Desulfitobacterium chlororespirans]|uniref:Uncharacterized protein n=1 Tax=Desulfitobacterium chlororespirans DSM 11544 TaxID=1121395 RepID=A0A1M7UP86_9FIRM|nr:hypothetical protein [Desulfitobacterium chlororespirans]SHN84831.1 hypothetical protein SAMN02745215_04289 [Desulfitobacterium chlororespirans DSM 11544]